MNHKRLLALALIAVILSGCAVMSAEECTYSDWTAVGYEDGAQGRTSDRFGDYRRACADHGITPDFQAWQSGRDQGLVEYCQPSRGFQVGQSGGNYNGVCGAALEPDFLAAYQMGARLFSLRRELNDVISRVDANARARERIDSRVDEIEARIILDETSQEERARLLNEMRELSEDRGELDTEADLLIQARTFAEMELTTFENSLIQQGF